MRLRSIRPSFIVSLVSVIALAVVTSLPHSTLLSAQGRAAKMISAGAAPGQASNMPEQGHGLNPADMDTTCKPCDDFFHYADGGWIKKNPIPPAYSRWGTFSELAERNRDNLHKILDAAMMKVDAPKGSDEQKIGDFYASCMNEPEVNALGAAPLDPEFKRIDAIHDVSGLQAEVARLHGEGVNAVFRFGSTQDEKNSSQVIGGAEQGGLGMPDRDYYTKTDDHSKELREKYAAHVAKMFGLLGDDSAKAQAEAKTVMGIETKLAEASFTRVERRDPEKNYHKMDRAQLKALTPDFSWTRYFVEIGYPNITTVDVAQPKFFEEVNKDLKAVSLDDWKTYLRWHVVDTFASDLSQPFVDEDFDFNSRTLQGTKEQLPRWKRCVTATDRQLGFALGKVYVKEYFPPIAKQRADEMVHNLIAALREDIKTLPWMGPETQKQAESKLAAYGLKIGYPTKWRDYSALHVDRGVYVENVMRGHEYLENRDLKKIGKPVDRTEWGMTPPTVNAYYSDERNEIVFPAGILQPPFFDPKADDAMNYGGMGAVIGHEMTHGFDDDGSQFDAKGNLENWWTKDDKKNFDERAKCVEEQFDNYVVQGNLHENGKLVLGESIADLGGLTIAFKAFQKTEEGKTNQPTIDGLTPDQRFFLSFARIWAGSATPQSERFLLNLDPHPLAQFRSIAAPSNMEQFRKAFDCKKGDPMVRPSPCQIW
jgi:putative endopeptidase